MDMMDHAEDLAGELAGNWQKFDSFGWSRRHELDDPDNWAIVYTHNRDSGLLTLSNATVIDRELAPYTGGEDPDAVKESHSHWACGWIDGYSIRVRRDGQITGAFLAYAELAVSLADYPILDESDYSERVYEDTLNNIGTVGYSLVREDAPDEWPGEVYELLPDSERESYDGDGGYPSEESVKTALGTLGYLDEDED